MAEISGVAQAMRVAVIGAGIAGPALACLLLQRLNCTTTLYESAPAIQEVGAGISLAPNGMKTLRQIGICDLAEATGERLLATHISKPNGDPIAVLQHKAPERYQENMMGFRRYRLRNVLLDKAQELGATLKLGHKLSGIVHGPEGRSARLEFDNGSTQEFDLVVGCDGLRSTTRSLIKDGKEPAPRYTGEEVVFAVTKQRHADICPQGTVQMVYGPGKKHFGAYGMAGDCCSWFIARQHQGTDDTWGLVAPGAEQEALLAELRQEFQGWELPQRFFNEAELAVAIRVGVFDRDPSSTWTRGVVTLAGDAANPIPPNLGQGGNKALEDVAVLVAALERHPGDTAAALQLYEQVRLPRAAAVLDHSRKAAAVADLESWWAVLARNMVFRLIANTTGKAPADFLWGYDCRSAVEAAAAKRAAGGK